LLRRLTDIVNQKVSEMDQTIGLKNDLRDAEALALLRTNRGKALMDEANVFLTGIIQGADDRLTAGVADQGNNTAMLRFVSIIGALVIILVVGIVTITVTRYTREVAAARDEVRLINATLEERVVKRTSDLERARDRAEAFLAEVNHRVANSLALVASMVSLQSRAVTDAAAKEALEETQGRIFAVSLVHKRLYSAGDTRTVALDEYISTLLEHLETSMRGEGLGASLRHRLEPISLPTDSSVNLGIVVTEWVTNAFKYAYPGRMGEVRVQLRRTEPGHAELIVEDDGVGRDQTSKPQGTGLGSRIVMAMSNTLGAEVRYEARQPGTRAVIAFAVE
jgi:two-component sensor histidine kinase